MYRSLGFKKFNAGALESRRLGVRRFRCLGLRELRVGETRELETSENRLQDFEISVLGSRFHCKVQGFRALHLAHSEHSECSQIFEVKERF